MNFEISERIRTTTRQDVIIAALEEQFKKVSEKVELKNNCLIVSSIEASFGSVNRYDTTTVELRSVDEGFLLIANVHYRPSVFFWIIFILLLFTWVAWLIPIAFYLMQKKTVRTAVQDVFIRVKNEFMTSEGVAPRKEGPTDLDQLQKLAQLREAGVLSEEEFQLKKVEILGLTTANPSSTDRTAPPSLPPQGDAQISCPRCGGAIPLRILNVGDNICPHCQAMFEVE